MKKQFLEQKSQKGCQEKIDKMFVGKQSPKDQGGEIDLESLTQKNRADTQPLDSLLPQIDKYRDNQYINVSKYFCNKVQSQQQSLAQSG